MALLVSGLACGPADTDTRNTATKPYGRDQATTADEEASTYYVVADTAAERSAPSSAAAIVNRVYRGQKISVDTTRDGWARISGPTYEARWVELRSLSTTRATGQFQPISTDFKDARIAADAIPSVGENGLSVADVKILRRGATHMLSTGRCAKVEYADKSVDKAATYYVNCGAANIFFTEADLPPK